MKANTKSPFNQAELRCAMCQGQNISGSSSGCTCLASFSHRNTNRNIPLDIPRARSDIKHIEYYFPGWGVNLGYFLFPYFVTLYNCDTTAPQRREYLLNG